MAEASQALCGRGNFLARWLMLLTLSFAVAVQPAMAQSVLRDAETEPPVHEVSQRHWGAPLGEIRSALLGGTSDPAVVAVVELAISFRTWQSLRHSGMRSPDAADLMARLVCLA